jgi:hypothetical protein
MNAFNDLQNRNDRMATLEAADKAFWANTLPIFVFVTIAFVAGVAVGAVLASRKFERDFILPENSGKPLLQLSESPR